MIILPKNSVLQWMQQQELELTLIRHRLHHEPELGHAEYKTTHLIRERLEAYGAELLPCRCDTGVVALVHGAADGPLLALREDIDALPITENTALPFASGSAGVSHACGHDIHTTALLGCAQYLCCHREALHGSVMLIFQCAEECCDGAETMLNAGLFDADKMDCPRIVRMRPRRAAPKLKIDRNCYEGRTYEDFTAFMADNPDVPVVQMDSVIGSKSGKVLLTMFFQNCNLLLAFLRDRNTARSGLEVFNDLYATLGRETYCKLFPVILTDRGSEFSNPVPIEQDENGELRSLVFYCNPSAPYQKGGIEVAHELIRRILPKGKSFDDLQQEDIDLMLSHINSYKRGKLNSRSAHQLFSFIYGDDILPKLNIREIEPNDIVLSPKLLKK